MECRSLDLTIISAEDLKDIQLIGKQDLYAVVTINGDARTKQKTKVDKDCGTKPKWKHQMKLTVDDTAARENRLTLVFQIVADRPIAGDKPVGEVSVPVKELLDQNKSADEEKTVTYAVRLPNGKTKGSLKFSFKFGEKYTLGSSSAPVPSTMDHKTMDQPTMAYPPGHGTPSGYPPQAGPSGYPPPGHDDKHGGAYGYPQPGGYPPPGQVGYPPAGPGGYPPPGGYPSPGAYPQQGGYPGYPPPHQSGYPGYPPPGQYGYPPQGQYGYPPQQQAHGKPKKNKAGMGMGMGLGLGAGLLGGLLVGEAVSDIADMGDDMGDMGGDFDF